LLEKSGLLKKYNANNFERQHTGFIKTLPVLRILGLFARPAGCLPTCGAKPFFSLAKRRRFAFLSWRRLSRLSQA
jgi:hypothetical protein